MKLNDVVINRWLTRGAQLFRTLARNPVVRSALRARGLTDEELNRGWTLYGAVLGFKRSAAAQPTPGPTEASLAVEELDAWDHRWFGATSAILQAPFPSAERFLFDNLKPEAGVKSVRAVEVYLDRLAALRDGKAEGVSADEGRAAVERLATRGVVTPDIEKELRQRIASARRGARPEEVIPAAVPDVELEQAAREFIAWCHEWREVARSAITRRDYRIALGLARRRRIGDGDDADDAEDVEDEGEGEEPAGT
jgi:hypothetical protein